MGDIVILRRLKRSERIVRFLLIFLTVIFAIICIALFSTNNTTEKRITREDQPIVDTYTIDYKKWIEENKALEAQLKKEAEEKAKKEAEEKAAAEAARKAAEQNAAIPGTPGNGATVYLTFDDGPNDPFTSQLLDLLKKRDIKVTFFVTCSGSDVMLRREFDEGHTIGLHTCSHNYAAVYANPDAYFGDLAAVGDRVARVTGQASTMIRFPGGSSNTVSATYYGGLMSLLVNEVHNRGFEYYDWDVSSGDASGAGYDAGTLCRNVVAGLGPGKNNIVLFHDRQQSTIDSVGCVIDWATANGYTFSALDRNSPTAHHRVFN